MALAGAGIALKMTMIREDIQNIMYALTLATRPKKARRWLRMGGFKRLKRRGVDLFAYWDKRLKEANKNDIQLFEKVLLEYSLSKKLSPKFVWLGDRWMPQKKNRLKATAREIQERMSLCFECVHFDPVPFNGTGRCSKCWCPIASKVSSAVDYCPEGNW